MAGVNKVILLGRLGKDPEVKEIGDGKKVANFSIATSEAYKDKDGNKQENTEWHNVVLWNKLADLAQSYLKKGQEVYIEGKLQTRSWDDKDGNKRYITEIVGTNINFIGGKNDSVDNADNDPNNKQPEPFKEATIEGDGEDLPF